MLAWQQVNPHKGLLVIPSPTPPTLPTGKQVPSQWVKQWISQVWWSKTMFSMVQSPHSRSVVWFNACTHLFIMCDTVLCSTITVFIFHNLLPSCIAICRFYIHHSWLRSCERVYPWHKPLPTCQTYCCVALCSCCDLLDGFWKNSTSPAALGWHDNDRMTPTRVFS